MYCTVCTERSIVFLFTSIKNLIILYSILSQLCAMANNSPEHSESLQAEQEESKARFVPPQDGVYGLLPPHEQLIDLASYGPVLIAQEECERNYEGDVLVVEDDAVQASVVEILGVSANLVFPCSTAMRYLILQMKNLNKYTAIEVEIIDSSRKRRKLQLTNSQSKVKIKENECSMPLVLSEGWNYVPLDLQSLVHNAYGTDLRRTICVQVFASCRLLHVFFQAQPYADAELPKHLQVL